MGQASNNKLKCDTEIITMTILNNNGERVSKITLQLNPFLFFKYI